MNEDDYPNHMNPKLSNEETLGAAIVVFMMFIGWPIALLIYLGLTGQLKGV